MLHHPHGADPVAPERRPDRLAELTVGRLVVARRVHRGGSTHAAAVAAQAANRVVPPACLVGEAHKPARLARGQAQRDGAALHRRREAGRAAVT
eukprot:scaffold40996_cov55-Phaeocystis_antarctica.AAC.1